MASFILSVLMFFSLCALPLVLGHAPHAHECIHDKLEHKTQSTFVKYDHHPFDNTKKNARRLSSNFAPIRIVPDFSNVEAAWSSTNAEKLTQVKRAVAGAVRYLKKITKVVPVSGNLKFSRNCAAHYIWNGQTYCATAGSDLVCGSCNHGPIVTIPTSMLDSLKLYDNRLNVVSELPGGAGTPNADIVIFVTASECNCFSTTQAWASACQVDQYGRPVSGIVNVCSNGDISDWEQTVTVLLHEMSHILFMSPSLFNTYRDSSGNVRSGVKSLVGTRYFVTTPTVKSVAQSYFNCMDNAVLPGGPLEDNGGAGSTISHWDFQHLFSEVMTPVAIKIRHSYSKFTFALMQDSGWYQVNMNEADNIVFGKSAGCSFISASATHCGSFSKFYCTDNDKCVFDGSAQGTCYPAQVFSPCRKAMMWDNVPACDSVTSTVDGASSGVNSRCVNFVRDANQQRASACYPTQCNGYNSNTGLYSSITLTIGSSTVTCSRSEIGSSKAAPSSSPLRGTIICPDFDLFCIGADPFGCSRGRKINGVCFCSVGYKGSTCNEVDNALLALSSSTIPPGTTATTTTVAPCTGIVLSLGMYFKTRNPLVTCDEYSAAAQRFKPCARVTSCTDEVYPNTGGLYRRVNLHVAVDSRTMNSLTATQWRIGINDQLNEMRSESITVAQEKVLAASLRTDIRILSEKEQVNVVMLAAVILCGLVLGKMWMDYLSRTRKPTSEDLLDEQTISLLA